MLKRWLLHTLLLLLALAGPGVAQTPDGQTPLNEGVCDGLLGATPGLYGLCVAYCEALDCDDDTLSLSSQCRPPNRKILENYDRKKQPGDLDMPCVQEPCPCWTFDELHTISATDPGECVNGEGNLFLILQLFPTATGASTEDASGNITCTWLDFGAGEFVTLSITPEEHNACRDQIIAHGTSEGFDCFPE